MPDETPYCEAQVGGMECGRPVEMWSHQCEKHDPDGASRRAARRAVFDYMRCKEIEAFEGWDDEQIQ